MSNVMYVNDIINLALSTIRAQSIVQSQDNLYQTNAIMLLNEVLDSLSSVGISIPFWSLFEFTLLPSKEKYTIGSIVGADGVTTPFVTINYVNLIWEGRSFDVAIQDDLPFYGVSQILNQKGRPSWCHITRQKDYSEMTFLCYPDYPYLCQIRGKKEIGQVSYQDYIDLPRWCSGYVRLKLSKKLNSFYNLRSWDNDLQSDLNDEERNMISSSKQDMAIQSSEPFESGIFRSSNNLGVIVK
jgi:hypothetical protein